MYPQRAAALVRIGELVQIVQSRANELDQLLVTILDLTIRGEIGDGGATSLTEAADHGDRIGLVLFSAGVLRLVWQLVQRRPIVLIGPWVCSTVDCRLGASRG